MAHVLECLPSQFKALSSKPSTARKKKSVSFKKGPWTNWLIGAQPLVLTLQMKLREIFVYSIAASYRLGNPPPWVQGPLLTWQVSLRPSG
jgi:hypothetical protein